jgi:hypothetical protein
MRRLQDYGRGASHACVSGRLLLASHNAPHTPATGRAGMACRSTETVWIGQRLYSHGAGYLDAFTIEQDWPALDNSSSVRYA